jgi:hypothetical protein
MALNTTLTCELIDNLILQRADMGSSPSQSLMEYYDNYKYMGQMAFQPGALIANWAWGQYNSNIPGLSNTSGIWPLTVTTYSGDNNNPPGLGAPYYATCLNTPKEEIRPGPTVPGYYYTAPRASPYSIANYQNFQSNANGSVWPGWWAQNLSNSSMLGSNSNSPYPWGGVFRKYNTQNQDPPNFNQNQFTWTANVIGESNFGGFNTGSTIGGAQYLGGAPSALTIDTKSGLQYSGKVLEIKCQNPIMGISEWENGESTRVYSTKRFQTAHLTGGYDNGNCPYCRIKLFNGDSDTQYQTLHNQLYPDSPADFDYLDLGAWAIKLTQVQM